MKRRVLPDGPRVASGAAQAARYASAVGSQTLRPVRPDSRRLAVNPGVRSKRPVTSRSLLVPAGLGREPVGVGRDRRGRRAVYRTSLGGPARGGLPRDRRLAGGLLGGRRLGGGLLPGG